MPLPHAPIRKRARAKAKRSIRLDDMQITHAPLSPAPVVSDTDTDTDTNPGQEPTSP